MMHGNYPAEKLTIRSRKDGSTHTCYLDKSGFMHVHQGEVYHMNGSQASQFSENTPR